MQSNQNHEGMAFVALLAIAWLFLQILFAFMLAIAIIVAVGTSIVSLCAWNKPLTLFGEVLTPSEARGFILRGIACGFAAMFVMALAEAIGLPFPLAPQAYYVFGLFGYLFGSLVIGAALEEEAEKARAAQESLPRQEILPPLAPPPPARPFDFADWRDEEELR